MLINIPTNMAIRGSSIFLFLVIAGRTISLGPNLFYFSLKPAVVEGRAIFRGPNIFYFSLKPAIVEGRTTAFRYFFYDCFSPLTFSYINLISFTSFFYLKKNEFES